MDPTNRLVARTLEQQWEACLQEINRLDTEFATFCRKQSPSLTPGQRETLLRLATDLPKIWFSPTTTWTERKDLIELLIADVTLTRHESGITVQLRWFTNAIETGQLPPPISGRGTSSVLVERIRDLYQQHTDKEIADVLNREGLKTLRGNAFTTKSVEMIRQRHHLPKYSAQR